MAKKPEPYHDKLGPLPPEHFDNDPAPPGDKPPAGMESLHDEVAKRIADSKPKPKK